MATRLLHSPKNSTLRGQGSIYLYSHPHQFWNTPSILNIYIYIYIYIYIIYIIYIYYIKVYWVVQNWCKPVNIIRIYYWGQGQWWSIWNTTGKKNAILWAWDIKSCVFFNLLLHPLPGHAILFWISNLSNKSLSYKLVASILRQF